MAPVIRAFDHQDYDAARLVEAKRGRTVSVCLPAHDEEATVGTIVRTIREQLVERPALRDGIPERHAPVGFSSRIQTWRCLTISLSSFCLNHRLM